MASLQVNEVLTESDVIGSTMMTTWDLLAIGIYFVLMVCTGIYSMFKPNHDTVAGYFLAGRFMWWLPIGASLFVSNIGSEHFIGLAGSGAASGISVGAFELNALVLLQLLGWIFLPVFIASGANTLPEYMSKRFGGRRVQTCLALLSVLLYIFTKISVNMYSGAIFIQQAFKWTNLYLSVTVLIALTGLLTIGGGLRAVIYTDTLQFFIILLGSLYVSLKAFNVVGGYSELRTKYMEAIPDKLIPNTTCGIPRADSWVMLRDANPAVSDMPWPGFILGQTPASIWYWCADQMMVQRVMAAKSLSHAQGATIFAGLTKLLPLFVIVMPGMISRVLFPNEVGCVDPEVCHNFCGANTCTNFAYPKLVFTYMPNGMRGVMLAVMLSALISDLTSIFNSASMLFTMDIWSLLRPKSLPREKLFIGRVFIVILVIISILWIPIIEQTQGGELYIYIQSIAAYLSPPIAAIYCLAILWKGMNESGAFWGLSSGFIVGITRMVLDFYFREPPCYEEDTRPAIVKNFHYMYFAVLLFWMTIIVAVLISKCTKPIEKWRLYRTTYFSRHDRRERQDDIDAICRKQTELLSVNSDIKEIDLEIQDISESKTILKSLFEEKEKSTKAKNEEAKMNQHIANLSNLHQEKWEKQLLNVMLVCILSMAVGLYVYFSINPFSTEEILEMQSQRLWEIKSRTYNITNETGLL